MSITKISQSQIKGNGNKADIAAELSAVELAISNVLGKVGYESSPDINLVEIGAMIDGDSSGMSLKVDVNAAGHSIIGASSVIGNVAQFATTHAGALDATSLTVNGSEQINGNLTVTGQVGGGSLLINAGGQVKGNMTVGNGVDGEGSLTVWGDLTVKGSTVTLDTSTLLVEDDRIVMAKGFADKDGAGFVLGNDNGAHKMVWDAQASKWVISDGVKTPGALFGGKLGADAAGIHGSADGLLVEGAGVVQFKDSFMPGPMDLSKVGEFALVFGPGAWADGKSLIGALNQAHLDAVSYADASYADLAADLAAEVTRATGAEAALAADIAAEAAARASADLAHDSAIATEIARAQGAETQIASDLSAEVVRATAAEAAISLSVTNEVSRATAAELVLTNGLAAEVTRATGAEGVLTSNLAAEVTRATGAEAALQAEIDALEIVVSNDYSALDGKITTEKNRAEAAELVLDGKIATEKSRAEGVEAGLAASIAAEATRAQAAEAALSASVAAETTRATAAEQALSTALAAEVTRATGAEAALSASLATETANRISGDQALQSQINGLKTDISVQASRVFMAVIPFDAQNPSYELAADSDLAVMYLVDGVPTEFVKPAGKVSSNYDMFLNGQQMVWNADFVFSEAGKVQFKFALKSGDVVRFREF